MTPDPAARGGMRVAAWRGLIRGTLAVYLVAVRVAGWRRRRPVPEAGARVLLTGTFHSDNWIRAHLGPLSASRGCARVTMVTTAPLPPMANVVAVFPPAWLRLLGAVPARLLTFAAIALRTRPDVVGGFHLLVNGLVAILVARLAGARSLYFAVGGPTEVVDGGVWGENPYFERLGYAHPGVERQLLAAVQAADLVVTMGTGAAAFLRGRGVTTAIEVVPGGIAPAPARSLVTADIDLVLVARLVPIKQIDRFVDAVARLAASRPAVRAVIVGDGPLAGPLQDQAQALGLGDRLVFAGFQPAVVPWLLRSRVFVLTSRSEGLALSLMEAMTCGLPAIVPAVGDLGDLVVDGVTGYLLDDPTPAALAHRFERLLGDPASLGAMSEAARLSSRAYGTSAAIARWDAILGSAAERHTPMLPPDAGSPAPQK